MRLCSIPLEAALTVYTREAMPREWADMQSNLGVACLRFRVSRDPLHEGAIAGALETLHAQRLFDLT